MKSEKEIFRQIEKLTKKETRVYKNSDLNTAFIRALFWVLEIDTYGNIPFKYILKNNCNLKRLRDVVQLEEEIEA